jgi:hypothetical protein
MGGGGGKKKKESNAERTARLAQAEQLGRGSNATSQARQALKAKRVRSSLFGGSETGRNTLGAG